MPVFNPRQRAPADPSSVRQHLLLVADALSFWPVASLPQPIAKVAVQCDESRKETCAGRPS